MKRKLSLSLALVFLFALVPIVQAASTTTGAASPSQGYVAYSVHVSRNGTQRSFSINESVTPSASPAKSIVMLSVQAAPSSNFTFSHVVNSSLVLFPFVPGITNQNFTFSGKSFNVTANISQQGTEQVLLQGKQYTLRDFVFSADIVSANGSKTLNGSVSAFPSGLVYSFTSKFNDTQVTATLTSTSLGLTATSAAPAVQAASAGLGLSLAGAAVALSLGVRARRKHQSHADSKPDHWVD